MAYVVITINWKSVATIKEERVEAACAAFHEKLQFQLDEIIKMPMKETQLTYLIMQPIDD